MTAIIAWRRWSLLLAIGVLFVAAAFYIDLSVVNFVARQQASRGVTFMRAVSRWGDWPTHVLVGLLGLGIAYARGSRRWVSIFAAMLIACALAGTLNRVIKVSAGRARPSVHAGHGWNGPSLRSKYQSFPSGHVACSTAFFVALCFARPRIGGALLAIPLLIAISRVYLTAHYLSDVFFAAALGVACALFTWRFLLPWLSKYEQISDILGRLEDE